MADWRNYLWLSATLTGISLPLPAADHFLMIGGGPMPQQSQVSIEQNIQWIDALMRQRPFRSRQLLFTSGDKKMSDIIEQPENNADIQHWLPLARLFGEVEDGKSRFRPNLISRVDGESTASAVSNTLAKTMSTLHKGDSLFVVYNGHGGWESPDPSKNTLRLWKDTQLNVRSFSHIAQLRPKGTILRYVMPQCFSGGFAQSIASNVVHPDPEHIDGEQCGFFSVPDNMESEGCTRSINSLGYRDYSTWFFAALTGATRQNGGVEKTPIEKPGPITLTDAHNWAYVHGRSTDIPFTTSEFFLELWQPWYVRWQSIKTPSASNPYFQTALELAKVLKLKSRSLPKLASIAIKRQQDLRQLLERSHQKLRELGDQEEKLRNRMLQAFLQYWPSAGQPYSAAYYELISTQADDMLYWITTQPQYPLLEMLQNDMDQVKQDSLEIRREAAGYARLHRMLKLATIREFFDRQASSKARKTYQALRHCEAWTLPTFKTNAAPQLSDNTIHREARQQ